MNCIIIDDEPLARVEMDALIREVSELTVLSHFANAVSALAFLEKNEVDLIFLDIEMPGIKGIDFATQISGKCLIVFTTAYPQFALQSYDLDAIDYLLKPIDKDRLERAIRKASLYSALLSENTVKNTVEANTADFFFIKAERRTYKLNFTDVLYIEGLKDYVVIYTTNQKLITAINLKNIHLKLPQDVFLRTSKSFVVNKMQVTSFDNRAVYLGDKEIPLGEMYRDSFVKSYADGYFGPVG